MPRQLHIAEFVAVSAVLFASAAFSIDGMLPSFPQMAADLSPDAPNRIQLSISMFILGMGIGTFIVGPISDVLGRKSIVLGGAVLFVAGCALASQAQSLETLLAGRILQGLGAAGPRIGPLAMMRDMYSGRRMAQLSSFVMTVFMLFPAVAPSIGALVAGVWGWRGLFLGFALFCLFGTFWLMIRQPETLRPEDRIRLNIGDVARSARIVMSNRLVVIFIIALTLGFAEMLSMISSIQLIYDQTFGRAENFPLWFALSAAIAATGTIVNAWLVMRLGMRWLAILAFSIQAVLALLAVIVLRIGILPAPYDFALWFAWSSSTFFMVGLIFGNLNALAMQPLGHVAGMASSLITGISTVGAALLAVPVGITFDGTPVPLMIWNLCFASVAGWLVWSTRRVPLDEFG